MPNETFKALLKEAQFTREMLGSGATQIRNANYATKGIYFQAFTSLSTGFECIGKLCLMINHYIDNGGTFPSTSYMKNVIGHNILRIHENSSSVIINRRISMKFLRNLDDPIRQGILTVLSEFGQGDRYSNINLLVGGGQSDPVASWFKLVDQPLWDACVTNRRKMVIRNNAAIVAEMLGPHSMILHTSELNREIADVEEASYATGQFQAIAKYRQLYVVQIIRYWVELLSSLQDEAMKANKEDIPFFSEVFAPFYNDDSYIKTRKTWHGL